MSTTHLRNNSIDIARLICAILVVSIHTRPLEDINPYLGYVAIEVLPRIAVPFFYCISGYFYIEKIESAREKIRVAFKKTFIKLLKVYLFWSVVFFLCDINSYFNAGMNWKGIIASYFLNFFVYGSYYHLWYFIGLFFSIIIVTAFYIIRWEKILAAGTIVLYALGVLGCAYYKVGTMVPGISVIISSSHFELLRRIVLMALPFYMSGYFVARIVKKEAEKNTGLKISIFVALFLIEIFTVNILQLASNVILTIFLYPLVIYMIIFLLKYPLENYCKLGMCSRYLANFIYFSHPLYIWGIQKFLVTTGTTLYVLTASLSVMLGYILMKLNCRKINQFIV